MITEADLEKLRAESLARTEKMPREVYCMADPNGRDPSDQWAQAAWGKWWTGPETSHSRHQGQAFYVRKDVVASRLAALEKVAEAARAYRDVDLEPPGIAGILDAGKALDDALAALDGGGS